MEIARLTPFSIAITSAFQKPKQHQMPTDSADEVTPEVTQSLCMPELNNVSTFYDSYTMLQTFEKLEILVLVCLSIWP